jgi:hypothetical protein
MKKSFRYKGNNCENEGVHSELMKTLITRGWHYDLNMPIPYNINEIKLLSKFIFGIELTVNFDRIYDNLLNKLKTDQSFERAFKLNQLSENKKDYFYCDNKWENNKLKLFMFSYECKQRHDYYYDHKFNKEVFKSSYEMDDSFWKHCVGELYCGGISGNSYGQVKIFSLKERERLLNIINNYNEESRQEFIDELNKLKILDKQYDNFLK